MKIKINKFYGMGRDASLNADEIDELMALGDDLQVISFVAGQKNLPKPHIVTGWRYGNIPASGRSFNHRDGFCEQGVSVMATDEDDETQDKISAFFVEISGKPKIKITGYLNTISKGSDGEPLLVNCSLV